MTFRNISSIGITILITLFLTSCGSGEKTDTKESTSTLNRDKETVIVHELSDADMLNPYNYQGAGSDYIMSNIFQSLLDINFETLELSPVLAESRPEIKKKPEGGLLITYRIRPEAKWPNGDQITAEDVAFSLKVMKCPGVDNQRLKPYYEFIRDIKFYDDDPLKFTFDCKQVYILAEASSGDFDIIPSYVYDPENHLKDFTVKEFSENAEELRRNDKVIAFAKNFNSEKYQREKGFIVGSGAYNFDRWETGQKIVLTKKKDWWGNGLTGENSYFQANAPKIVYQTINDQTGAIVALKAEELDVMRGIKQKDFSELPNSEKFADNFNTHTPPQMAYTYLGINTRLPKFSDKKTRQALAHLVDVEKIIDVIAYGYGKRVIGPIHPSKKKQYNENIKPYEYNIKKAKKLLEEAGWKDTDGDGTLDKDINGTKTDFTIDFTYNSGNDTRKSTALLFQEAARKVGIKVNVLAQEWSVYINNQKNHNFEMYYGAWISSPTPNDHKQIFHTESYNGGSNYTGFGNAETDALIDSIRVTLDEDKRAELNHEFQRVLHEWCSYIFMYSPTERIAIHKRFKNAETSAMRPGYWVAGFKVPESTAKTAAK